MKNRFALFSLMGRDGALSKIHELVREMPVSRVMTPNPATLSPDATMQQLKELMRERRISGAPIVEQDKLVGVVSIEDLIHAMEQGELGQPIRKYMASGNLIVAQAQEPVMEALRRFEKTGVGRMPVLDAREQLVGIITRGDITEALLHTLQGVYTEAEQIQSQPQHFFEALESEGTNLLLRYHVEKDDFARGGDASGKIKQALLRIGAAPKLARRVAIATYEAEINLIAHADDGGFILADIQPNEINVVAQDSGPGIADVELARQPGYSTASPHVREMGFGAGMGLVNIDRCSDEMTIWSAVGVGTRLQMKFNVSPEEARIR